MGGAVKEPDHLYFIAQPEAADGSRWVKIGRSRDVANRIQQLQCASPHRLDVLGVAVGMGHQEKATHSRLGSVRGNGEWFLLERWQWEKLRDQIRQDFPDWSATYQEREFPRARSDADANQKRRERYAKDPAHREKVLSRNRKRYAEDPAFREQRRKDALARKAALREEKREEALASKRAYMREYKRRRCEEDPGYREKQREYVRAHRAKKAAAA